MIRSLVAVALLAVASASFGQDAAPAPQAQQAAQAQDAQGADTFKKAWGACLEGRGYSVK
jgi:hypothetical protein